MAKAEKFEEDLTSLLLKLTQNMKEEGAEENLNRLKDRLIQLHRQNVVKINHSVMELVCAKHLILKGYEVQVEHPLNGGLICDLYAMKGYGNLIVEIETGFIPPEHALDPTTYISARTASKIIRYSNFSSKFALGTPPHYIFQIPPVLAEPSRQRTSKDLEAIKNLCDLYYQNPPVSLEEVKNAHLHIIYIIDVDSAKVQEIDTDTYIKPRTISNHE